MGRKLRYEIDLTRPIRSVQPGGHTVRSITSGDLHGLARLMLDAYIGTIDYEGENLEEAVEEVRSYLDDSLPLLDRSYAVESEGALVSAVLVSLSEGVPFIRAVMTDPDHKNLGLGRLVVTTSVVGLAEDGRERMFFYITVGNLASEAMFNSIGAVNTPIDSQRASTHGLISATT